MIWYARITKIEEKIPKITGLAATAASWKQDTQRQWSSQRSSFWYKHFRHWS